MHVFLFLFQFSIGFQISVGYSVEDLKSELSLLHSPSIPINDQILLYGPPYKVLDNKFFANIQVSFEAV